MEELGDDILMDILSRVPARSLARLKWTSKRWLALISHPTFVKLHLGRASQKKILHLEFDSSSGIAALEPVCVDLESLEAGTSRLHDPTKSFPPILSASIEGTCDGLVCLTLATTAQPHRLVICLWNPSTGEFRELPGIRNCIPVASEYGLFLYVGLGYDCEADDYKVVTLVFHNDTLHDCPAVLVFSRKSSTWKIVEEIPEVGDFSGGPTHLNGAVHWLARDFILSYSLAKEKFQKLQIPEDGPEHPTLGILDGCLCVYTGCWHGNRNFRAWIMKEYGVEASWIQLFSIRVGGIPGYLQYLQLLRPTNGKTILVWRVEDRTFLYNLEEKSCRELPHAFSVSKSCVYIESFVSPYCVGPER